MRDVFLAPRDVAQRLLVSDSTVHRWLRQGSLRGTKAGRQWRIQYGDLVAFLREPRPGAPSDPQRVALCLELYRLSPRLPEALFGFLEAVYQDKDPAAVADWQDILEAMERGELASPGMLRSEKGRTLVQAWRPGGVAVAA